MKIMTIKYHSKNNFKICSIYRVFMYKIFYLIIYEAKTQLKDLWIMKIIYKKD